MKHLLLWLACLGMGLAIGGCAPTTPVDTGAQPTENLPTIRVEPSPARPPVTQEVTIIPEDGKGPVFGSAGPSHEILISTEGNSVNVGEWGKSGEANGIPWSIKKHPLHGGKQEGVDVIELDNGKMKMTIIPTRGMGILSVTCGDVRLGWDSPVKEVVNPAFINLQSRGGLGWLEGFNEYIVRCGLEFNGHPGTDKFINNVGEEATMDLTLHGKIQNTPASEVEVLLEHKPPYRIHIRGRVDERMFYGPKLQLWTDLSTEPGSTEFRIEDVITNKGPEPQEFEMLYHTNYGMPLLEEGSACLVPAEHIMPFNAHAAEGIKDYSVYAGPKLGFIEQVYCVFPKTDKDHRTLAMLENSKKDRGISLAWSTDELPFFTIWKNTTAIENGYVTGLEPGTGFAYNRRIEREAGRVPKLAAGMSRHFTIDFAIHVGAEQVKRVADRIGAIQGDKPPVLEQTAPKVE